MNEQEFKIKKIALKAAVKFSKKKMFNSGGVIEVAKTFEKYLKDELSKAEI